MLPMQGRTGRGLSHDTPPEASADYNHTGWEDGL